MTQPNSSNKQELKKKKNLTAVEPFFMEWFFLGVEDLFSKQLLVLLFITILVP
jgi:hypothetical protein